MSQLTSAGNHSHFARLFLKQLVQVFYFPILLNHITMTDCLYNNKLNIFFYLDVQRSSCQQFFWRRSWCRPARHCWSWQFGATEAPWRASNSASRCRWALPTSVLPRSPGVLPGILTDGQLVRPKKKSKISIKFNNLAQSFFFFTWYYKIEHLAWQKIKALNVTRPIIFSSSNISNSISTSCQLNQHLQDSLCQQLLQLDDVSIQSTPASIREGEAVEGEVEGDGDMEQQVVCKSNTEEQE